MIPPRFGGAAVVSVEAVQMFGHGWELQTSVKWPSTWYGAYEFVDVLGRLPEAWLHRPEDRRSVAEIAACLLA